ncbi:hypothetical protein VUR80DRAFT_2096 [Thermomyces stellatus]
MAGSSRLRASSSSATRRSCSDRRPSARWMSRSCFSCARRTSFSYLPSSSTETLPRDSLDRWLRELVWPMRLFSARSGFFRSAGAMVRVARRRPSSFCPRVVCPCGDVCVGAWRCRPFFFYFSLVSFLRRISGVPNVGVVSGYRNSVVTLVAVYITPANSSYEFDCRRISGGSTGRDSAS